MSKNQELEELFNTVSLIYQKNIAYLKKHHPNILKKILEFEKLNIENYFLEFENNHFELKDKNGKRYYNCDPFLDSQKRCEKMEEKPFFSLIKTKKIENHVHYKNSINAYCYINDYITSNSDKQNFDKFIFFGTQLGVHINDIHNIIKANYYLILENNIEIFRLSMFLTDYEDIEKVSKILFCIAEDESSTIDYINKFYTQNYEYNNFIYFELANENYLDYIDLVSKRFMDLDPFNYPFNEYLVSLQRTYKNLEYTQNGILSFEQKFEYLNDKPVLFLGAGPSLAKYCEWIYMNQDKFIIVCAAACLKRLELLDIIPDIILSVDGQYKQVIHNFEVNEKYYKNSICIFSTKTDEDVIKKVNNENLFLMQDNLQIFEKALYFTGLNVGDVGLKVLLSLGLKNIYLLGYDSAISDKGTTHDGIYKIRKVKNSDKITEVKGNFSTKVETLFLYQQMIDSFNTILSHLPKETKIYNLSNGAYFNNTVPIKAEDININSYFSKNILKNDLKDLFQKNMINELNSKDLNNIKFELKVLKKIKSEKKPNIDKYKSNYRNSICIQIIDKFYKLLKPYSNFYNKEEVFYIQLKSVINKLEEIFSNS